MKKKVVCVKAICVNVWGMPWHKMCLYQVCVCVCEWLALIVIDNCTLRFVLRYFVKVWLHFLWILKVEVTRASSSTLLYPPCFIHGTCKCGDITCLNWHRLIFEESPLDQHESSLDSVFGHEKDNQQELNANHVTLNAIECMLLQNLKKDIDEQRKQINDLSHNIILAMEFF